MTDDIRALSAELARDPSSLVFLTLGEALRRRGQLDAALRIALNGVARHPNLADAHDLLGRIHADRYDFEQAFEAWDTVLHLVPEHPGAHQGLGFLYFRVGDLERSISHLEEAEAAKPGDPSIRRALETVRGYAAERPDAASPGAERNDADFAAAQHTSSMPHVTMDVARPPMFVGFEDADRSMVLLDRQGRVLGGQLALDDGRDLTEAIAAFLAGVSQECERTARLLGLGRWRGLAAEADGGQVHVTQPTAQSLLLVTRDRSVPLGRGAYVAERAATVARAWLERES